VFFFYCPNLPLKGALPILLFEIQCLPAPEPVDDSINPIVADTIFLDGRQFFLSLFPYPSVLTLGVRVRRFIYDPPPLSLFVDDF